MPDDRPAERIAGKTLRFTWTDGPTQNERHDHVFRDDGSVEYRKVSEASDAQWTREKRYGAVKAAEDVYIVSYLAASGYTLTVALNFRDHSMVGFASNDKQWFPLKGRFEELG